MTPLLIAAGVAVAAGAALQSATGFGFALLVAPLAFAALDPEEAIGLLLLLGMEIGVLTLATEGRRPRPFVRRRESCWAAPLTGLAAGALVTSTNTTGPPLLLYVVGRGDEPARVRDTVTVCQLGLNVIGAVAMAVTGTSGALDQQLHQRRAVAAPAGLGKRREVVDVEVAAPGEVAGDAEPGGGGRMVGAALDHGSDPVALGALL